MAIDLMPERDKDGSFYYKQDAFKAKTVAGGKSLYKRVHGESFNVASSTLTNCDYVISYNHAKIEALEIINCDVGDYINFKVYDDENGTYSGTANALLNQHAFNTYLSQGNYDQRSQYDADVYLGLKLRIEYYNASADKDVYINYILNEVK